MSIPNLHNVNNTSMEGWKAKLPHYTRSLRKRIHEEKLPVLLLNIIFALITLSVEFVTRVTDFRVARQKRYFICLPLKASRLTFAVLFYTRGVLSVLTMLDKCFTASGNASPV